MGWASRANKRKRSEKPKAEPLAVVVPEPEPPPMLNRRMPLRSAALLLALSGMDLRALEGK